MRKLIFTALAVLGFAIVASSIAPAAHAIQAGFVDSQNNGENR
jgi:hypothetical protein